MAQDNLMMLKEADQHKTFNCNWPIRSRAWWETQHRHLGPGTSSLITAAAVSGEIRSQAVTQKMLAAMMRQEAARVAHDNAVRKRNAAYAGQLQTDMTNVLQHR